MTLPTLFPVDKDLITAAERMDGGADVESRDSLLTAYRSSILKYNASGSDADWKTVVNFERRLRGLVTEAEIGRRRGLPYLKLDLVEW